MQFSNERNIQIHRPLIQARVLLRGLKRSSNDSLCPLMLYLSSGMLLCVSRSVVPWSTHWAIRILVPMSYLKLRNYIYIYRCIYILHIYIYIYIHRCLRIHIPKSNFQTNGLFRSIGRESKREFFTSWSGAET